MTTNQPSSAVDELRAVAFLMIGSGVKYIRPNTGDKDQLVLLADAERIITAQEQEAEILRSEAENLRSMVTGYGLHITAQEQQIAELKAQRITLWECPACGFGFDAQHEDEGGGYTCPSCKQDELEAKLAALQEPIEILKRWQVWRKGNSWMIANAADGDSPTVGEWIELSNAFSAIAALENSKPAED